MSDFFERNSKRWPNAIIFYQEGNGLHYLDNGVTTTTTIDQYVILRNNFNQSGRHTVINQK